MKEAEIIRFSVSAPFLFSDLLILTVILLTDT